MPRGAAPISASRRCGERVPDQRAKREGAAEQQRSGSGPPLANDETACGERQQRRHEQERTFLAAPQVRNLQVQGQLGGAVEPRIAIAEVIAGKVQDEGERGGA